MEDAHYSGEATLIQDDLETEIQCSYAVSVDRPLGSLGPVGLSSWEGTFTVEGEGPGPLAGEAILRLPDGREGAVSVSLIVSPGPGIRGRVVGNGPPPG